MNRRKLLFLTAFLLLTFTASTAAVLAGQTQATAPAGPLLGSPHFQLDWNVTGSGGGTVGSAHFQVSSTIGQPAVGLAGSSNFDLCSGFWCKVLAVFELYLPVQVKN